MKLTLSDISHSRPDCAHWPEPLTAPGAAQACPSCLPSPSNQQTSQGDSRHDRPIERAVRFASVPSQLGGGTRNDPLSLPKCRFRHLDIGTLALRFRPFAPARPASAGSPQHALRSGQIGSPVRTTYAKAAHFQEASASLHVSRQIGGHTSSRPSVLPLPIPARGALIFGIREVRPRLRPLAQAAFTDPANQLTCFDFLIFARPFLPSSLSSKPRLRAERNGGLNHSPKSGIWHHPTTLGTDQSGIPPLPNVIGHSDFPWESPSRFFDAQKISVLRVSGTLRSNPFSRQTSK